MVSIFWQDQAEFPTIFSIRKSSISDNKKGFCNNLVKKDRAKSCPTLFHFIDCSLPGSSVHGILQARILEWVAISFSKQFSKLGVNLLADLCWTGDPSHTSLREGTIGKKTYPIFLFLGCVFNFRFPTERYVGPVILGSRQVWVRACTKQLKEWFSPSSSLVASPSVTNFRQGGEERGDQTPLGFYVAAVFRTFKNKQIWRLNPNLQSFSST